MMSFLTHMLLAARNYGVEAPPEPVPVIEFYCTAEYQEIIPEPISAGKRMPDWFKKIKPGVDDGGRDQFGAVGSTAKRCLPLMDAMSLGYIIPLFADVNIRTDHAKNMTIGPTQTTVADKHPVAQLGGPANNLSKFPAVKFINKWLIKTPPGWSTLFVAPINGTEDRFTCLSAVVDTDNYPSEINFPAIWHVADYDGIVKAGTPLVTAIPFKRDTTDIEMLVRKMSPGDVFDHNKVIRTQRLRGSYYTKELREPR